MRKNRQVLVAGAGPTGLAAAVFLRDRNIDVDIVDPHDRAPADDLAVILHADTVQQLADHGVQLGPPEQARAIEVVEVFDRDRWHASLPLGRTTLTPAPVTVIPMWRLCERLEHALGERGVKVRWNHRLARIDSHDEHVDAYVDVLDVDSTGYGAMQDEQIVVRTERYDVQYLIAADGRESVARTQLRIGWRPLAAAELMVAFEVDAGIDLGHELRIVLDEVATSIWPLPGGGLRLTFHLPLGSSQRPQAGTERDALLALVRAHTPSLERQIRGLRGHRVVRVEPALAERPNLGHTWLLGHAAWTLPLAASQSLNQGLHEAAALASSIALAVRDHAAHEPLERHARNSQAAARWTASIGDAYDARGDADDFVASSYRRLLPLLPALGPSLDPIVRPLGLDRAAPH
jgi:2-polyprenyl-6-methoxyphenol hydroxylase-like FAD-dependent oxidoreductase